MANQKLINPADIRTMRKDIRQIRKTGYAKRNEKTVELKSAIEKPVIANQPLKEKKREPISYKIYSMLHKKEGVGGFAKKEPVLQTEIKTQVAPPKSENKEAVSQMKQDKPAGQKPYIAATKESQELKESQPPEVKPAEKTQDIKTEVIKQINIQTKEREYLKNMPPAQKEKLQSSVKIEQEQRRKFMEDVEKWASSAENNKQS